MKALVYKAPSRVEVTDVDKPRIEQPTDAIVRVTTAGICGSDLHIYHGAPFAAEGLTVGHEFVGLVDELGPAVQNFEFGERVYVEAGFRCGICEPCKQQLPFCPNGGIFGTATPLGTLQGGQAEFVRVPMAQRIMHKFPEHLSDEDVILLTDNLPTGYTAADWGAIRPGDVVAAYGCGPVGLCALACVKMFDPARVYAIDLLDYRLEAAQKLGCIPINASKEDPVARIRMDTTLVGADVALETVGAPATLTNAFRTVKPGGTVSSVGIFGQDVTIPITELMVPTLTLRMGIASAESLPRLQAKVERGELDLKFILTHTFPLAEGARAYELFDRKEDNVLKVLLKP